MGLVNIPGPKLTINNCSHVVKVKSCLVVSVPVIPCNESFDQPPHVNEDHRLPKRAIRRSSVVAASPRVAASPGSRGRNLVWMSQGDHERLQRPRCEPTTSCHVSAPS